MKALFKDSLDTMVIDFQQIAVWMLLHYTHNLKKNQYTIKHYITAICSVPNLDFL